MKTSFGSAIVMLFIFLFGAGLTVGMLMSDIEMLNPEQTRINSLVLSEKSRLDFIRAQEELESARQQRAQALENQRLMGQATAHLTRQGGIVLVYALAMAIVLLSGGSAWRMIVQGIIALDQYRTAQLSKPLRPAAKQLAPAPLPFPERRPLQSVRKEL